MRSKLDVLPVFKILFLSIIIGNRAKLPPRQLSASELATRTMHSSASKGLMLSSGRARALSLDLSRGFHRFVDSKVIRNHCDHLV